MITKGKGWKNVRYAVEVSIPLPMRNMWKCARKYFSRKGRNSVVKSKEVLVKRNDSFYFGVFKFMRISKLNVWCDEFLFEKNKQLETLFIWLKQKYKM